jgi:hypothetical protein
MRGLIRLAFALACMVVVGVMATSALAALPDLHIALGEAFPVTATSEAPKASTQLGSASGAVLTGTGVKTVLTWTALSSAGTYVATFSGVAKGAKKCNTKGDAAGTVKISDAINLVFVELTPGLKIAALFLVGGKEEKTPIVIECEGLVVEVKGKVLSTYNGPLNSDFTEFKGALLGEKGKQALTKYENEAGTSVEAILLSEAGAGFVKSDQNVSEEVTFKANKMIEILG